MRSKREVELVLGLVKQGYNDCEVSRLTGVPRRTVLAWRHGQLPRHSRTDPGSSTTCERCGHPRHEFSKLPLESYAYLLGMYLGDGCISRGNRNVFVLRIALDRRYPAIVRECARAMAAVLPTSRVGIYSHPRENVEQVGSYSRSWPCLLPQHGSGKKHERRIELMRWQLQMRTQAPWALLRGLIHSDGCRHLNTIRHPQKTYRYPRYEFSNRSGDIRRIFCETCDLVGVEWRRMNSATVSVARRRSVALMDEHIGPKR